MTHTEYKRTHPLKKNDMRNKVRMPKDRIEARKYWTPEQKAAWYKLCKFTFKFADRDRGSTVEGNRPLQSFTLNRREYLFLTLWETMELTEDHNNLQTPEGPAWERHVARRNAARLRAKQESQFG